MHITNHRTIGIIPARYESTRLPGKPLADINGKPLIQRVWSAVSDSKLLDRVVIATDDQRIIDHCLTIGAECIMTPKELPSGTDRIMFAYNSLNETADFVLNIQGDEPFIQGAVLDNLINEFIDSKSEAGTLIRRIEDPSELGDPSAVKVVLSADHNALYFSRAAIPFVRDANPADALKHINFWKHIGVYIFTISTLRKFISLPQSALEQTEKLEQLRLLESGTKIFCVETDINLIGVDTPEDLERVRKILF